jgi:hypothetical protein
MYQETVCQPNTLKHICSGKACQTIPTVVEVCRAVKSAKVVRMDENSRPGSVGTYLVKKCSGVGSEGRIFLSAETFRLLNTSEPLGIVKIELSVY